LLAHHSARAQTVNYGDLEELFGEPVTTSATGKPQKVSEVPINMEILTQDDIRRSGVDSLPDLLQFVTGLNFRRSSVNDGEVGLRGYDQPWNPRLLVLVNDRPVYEDFYGDVVWAALPVQLDEIRQVEIVKGPNSALFGFNAASGVINIVTDDPLLDDTNAITARAGTQSLAEGSAVATFKDGRTMGARLSVGGMSAHEFSTAETSTGSPQGLLRPRNGTVNLDSRWQVAPGVLVSLEGNSGTMRRNFPADGTPEDDRTSTIRGRMQASTDYGVVDLDIYRTAWHIHYEGSQAQIAENAATDARLSDLFLLGKDHTIRLNVEYKNNVADGQFFNGSTIGYNVYSVGGMWNWQIMPRLSLTNAGREDYLSLYEDGGILPQTGLTPNDFNNRTLSAFSFNSGLVYHPGDDDVMRLMASRGYQLPSLDDLGQQITRPGAILVGSPFLSPTAVLNYEADYDHTFRSLGTVLRTAVFRQFNSHLFGYDVNAPIPYGSTLLYQSQNFGSSRELGFEIGLHGEKKVPFRWNLSYSFATIKDSVYPTIAPGAYTSFSEGTPKHSVYAGIGYSFDRWDLDALARWQSAITDYRYNAVLGYAPVALKNYVTANLHVGYHLTDHLTLGATAEQFNQARIWERASVPDQRRFIASVTAQF
jgi:iron complex outermembrane receptor protein